MDGWDDRWNPNQTWDWGSAPTTYLGKYLMYVPSGTYVRTYNIPSTEVTTRC